MQFPRIPQSDTKTSIHPRLFGGLAGEQVPLDGEHLARRGRHEAVDLARILLDLAAVEHALQTAGLLGELEQPLPLVLGERGLLEGGAGRVLGLALGDPLVDLGLLAGERALVVLEVVGLGVVGLDAVEEEVAVLLEEGVDAEGQVVVVGRQNGVLDEGAGLQRSERRGEIRRGRLAGALELVEEGRDQVGVVDFDRELNEDVLVSQARLLQSVRC
jgi:hypothetical protein